MVYLEALTRRSVLPAEKERLLINSLLDQQYQRFLLWWERNSDSFSNLSFDVKKQARQFISDLNHGLDLDTAFLKIRSDLWGYYLEYIKQEAFLPFTNRIENGQLVGDFYGEKPIVDLVDEEERDGAVKEAMEDLERQLILLKEEEMIFRVSPMGWTGLGYDYTETQFQLFWKKGNLIRGLTIRTGANLEAIVKMLKDEFQRDLSLLSGEELIKAITKINITSPFSLEDLVEIVSQASGGRDHQGRDLIPQFERWKSNDGSYKTYDQLILLLNFLENRIIDSLNDDRFNQNELEALLGFALMIMAEKDKKEKENLLQINYRHSFSLDTQYSVIDQRRLNQIFSYLMSLPGCAGGGQSEETYSIFDFNRFKLTPFGPVDIVLGESKDKESSVLKCVNCPFCHQTVDAKIEKGYIICPSCGAKAKMDNNNHNNN